MLIKPSCDPHMMSRIPRRVQQDSATGAIGEQLVKLRGQHVAGPPGVEVADDAVDDHHPGIAALDRLADLLGELAGADLPRVVLPDLQTPGLDVVPDRGPDALGPHDERLGPWGHRAGNRVRSRVAVDWPWARF
jgi:hypothetical protein